MLRILHTADWHLGHVLNGWSRLAEHRAAFDALAAIVERDAIDALIVAGDVFDTANPPAEARALFFDTLDRLSRLRPQLVTVVVAGNHDHAAQLEAPGPLYRRAGVRVVGTVHRADGGIDLDHHLIAIGAGADAGHVLALPYPRPSDLPAGLAPLADGSNPRIAAVRALYADAVAAARARIGDGPLILTGHLTVAGGEESPGSERMIMIGGENAVPHDVFPADVAYVALGHLHKPQAAGRANVRYSGSLFPLSAAERDYRHGVTRLDIDAGRVVHTHLELPRPVPFLRLPARGTLAVAEVEAALAGLDLSPDLPLDRRPFVHIVVGVDGPATGLLAEIEAIVERFPVRLASRPEFVRPAPTETLAAAAPMRRLAEIDPVELFRAAFELRHGTPPGDAHEQAFRQLVAGDASA
ncbi:MAG: exonuclease SbcCD subunit D [Hyphomicrobiaceae bacterium]|nr:exonuclease SbcCD subunit D [Hyphomicrobiaceae bacterium]